MALRSQGLRLDRPQRCVIIKNIDSPTEGSGDQVVLPPLYRQIADVDGRKPPLELDPFLPAIDGEKETELRPHKQQIRIDVVFVDCPEGTILRQVARDRSPGRT